MDKKSKRRPKWMEYLQAKFHRPIFASLVIGSVLLVSGSTYAAVGGLNGIIALFGGQKTLPDGSRIVRVDTQSCPHVDAFNATDRNRTNNGSYYYKINSGSKLTNARVVSIVQGACEADVEGIANGKIVNAIENEPQNKDRLISGYADTVITAIDPNHLSIRFTMPYATDSGIDNWTIAQTFTRIDPAVTVVSNGQKQSYSALKSGDHVAISYRATGDALSHSETLAPDKIDTSAQTVIIITRLSPHMAQYYDFQKYNSKDFEQVTPCKKTPTGYCTVKQYYQD